MILLAFCFVFFFFWFLLQRLYCLSMCVCDCLLVHEDVCVLMYIKLNGNNEKKKTRGIVQSYFKQRLHNNIATLHSTIF